MSRGSAFSLSNLAYGATKHPAQHVSAQTKKAQQHTRNRQTTHKSKLANKLKKEISTNNANNYKTNKQARKPASKQTTETNPTASQESIGLPRGGGGKRKILGDKGLRAKGEKGSQPGKGKRRSQGGKGLRGERGETGKGGKRS